MKLTEINLGHWNKLNIKSITNLFLYGALETPSEYPNRLRTSQEYEDLPQNDQQKPILKVTLNMPLFMGNGPGRYAHASEAPFVQDFFSAFPILVPDGRYTTQSLIDRFKAEFILAGDTEEQATTKANLKFGVSFKHYDIDSDSSDYAERVYIYNSAGFIISRDAIFVIANNGATRHVENMAVHALTDNFDFTTANNNLVDELAQLGNDFILGDQVDPYKIGRTVQILFDNKEGVPTTPEYRLEHFQQDQAAAAAQNHGTLLLDALPAMLQVVDDLKTAGTIAYETPTGGKVIYGSHTTTPIEGTDNDDIIVVGEQDKTIAGRNGNDVYYDGLGSGAYTDTGGANEYHFIHSLFGNDTITDPGTFRVFIDGFEFKGYAIQPRGEMITRYAATHKNGQVYELEHVGIDLTIRPSGETRYIKLINFRPHQINVGLGEQTMQKFISIPSDDVPWDSYVNQLNCLEKGPVYVTAPSGTATGRIVGSPQNDIISVGTGGRATSAFDKIELWGCGGKDKLYGGSQESGGEDLYVSGNKGSILVAGPNRGTTFYSSGPNDICILNGNLERSASLIKPSTHSTMCAIDLRAFKPPAQPELAQLWTYATGAIHTLAIPIDGLPRRYWYTVDFGGPGRVAGEPPVLITGGSAPNTETVVRPSAKRSLTEGTPGNDRMIGTDGDDDFNGKDGDDIITGGEGNDTLEGGIGYNFMRGGPGRDRFRITRRTQQPIYDYETRSYEIENDTIDDFNPEEDTLDVSAFPTVEDFGDIRIGMFNNASDITMLRWTGPNNIPHHVILRDVTPSMLQPNHFVGVNGTLPPAPPPPIEPPAEPITPTAPLPPFIPPVEPVRPVPLPDTPPPVQNGNNSNPNAQSNNSGLAIGLAFAGGLVLIVFLGVLAYKYHEPFRRKTRELWDRASDSTAGQAIGRMRDSAMAVINRSLHPQQPQAQAPVNTPALPVVIAPDDTEVEMSTYESASNTPRETSASSSEEESIIIDTSRQARRLERAEGFVAKVLTERLPALKDKFTVTHDEKQVVVSIHTEAHSNEKDQKPTVTYTPELYTFKTQQLLNQHSGNNAEWHSDTTHYQVTLPITVAEELGRKKNLPPLEALLASRQNGQGVQTQSM